MAESPGAFAGLLRELRLGAQLTQEELAVAAQVSLRTVSDLERGVAATPQRETVRLLADALRLVGLARTRFEAVARGRPVSVGAVAATRTLPRDVTSFTGRQGELARLAEAAAGAGGVVGIHAIGGMAGVGKTAFTVHAAHRLTDRYPGGQIFLPLHGHTPGRQPVEPADALVSLLLTIGVPAAQIPPGLEARMALWRDRVASRQLLLVLDDAASSEQVRPLLPGSGGSLVLVTSRRHLSALDDAAAISLDTLPPDEAAGLLVRLTGRAGLNPSDPGVRDIVQLCGFLPLAIGMVARQLRHHPAWSAAGRAAELAAARDRLELMATEDLSVTAAFNLSYADLAPGQQRLFRRLGLHPGADIDRYAAAALGGIELAAARRGLGDLYDQYLLTEPAPGRYRMHDLIREHARACAARDDPAETSDAAVGRLLDHYQHAAARADAFIARQTRPDPFGVAGATEVAGVTGVAGTGAAAVIIPATPADGEQALAWARTERAGLLACLDYAAGTGQHARVVALTAGLSGLLYTDGPWVDAIARHTAALAAARQLGDRTGQANALNDLGAMRRLTGDNHAAIGDLEEANGLYRQLGDRLGQANALHHLGTVWQQTGDYPAAARDLEAALGLYRELGDRHGEANALNFLGSVRRLTGDNHAAVRDFETALGLFREIGNRFGEANALSFLGVVRQQTGDYPAATQDLDEALAIFRELGDRLGAANALSFLGVVGRLTGDYPAAARDLDEALAIFRELGDRGGEDEALNERGTLHRVSGELPQAEACHQRALELARALSDRFGQAHALAGLGRCALAAGDATQAGNLLRQALEIFQQIGAAEVADVAAELETLAGS